MADSSIRPLTGVRVLDLSRVFAGPVAGRILADLGAEVVKVEPPEGDVTRLWGRPVAGLSTYFTQQNLGKEDICVDLTKPEGPALILELAAKADVVVENFRPGVMARFGLDWNALSAVNDRLIMLSISGFGQTGPEAQRAAYASVIHAEVGLIEQDNDQSDGTIPLDVSFSAADVLSGMHGVIAVMGALRLRDHTGVGEHIDMAMMDAMAFSNDNIQSSLDNRFSEKKNGEVWQTVSGPFCIPGGLRWIWHQMTKIHGLTDPTPSDAPVAEKIANRRAIVTDYFCALPDRAAVIDCLDTANLAWGELRELNEVLESPTIVHRETVAQVDNRDGGTRPIIRSPYRVNERTTEDVGVAPHRGEHNHEVLARWLDYDEAQVEQLAKSDVLLADEWAAPGQATPEQGENA